MDNYITLPRQRGHTHSAINGVFNSETAILIVLHPNQVKMVEHEYPSLRGRVKSFYSFKEQGIISPIVFDHLVVEYLNNESQSKIKGLVQEVEWLREFLKDTKEKLRQSNKPKSKKWWKFWE